MVKNKIIAVDMDEVLAESMKSMIKSKILGSNVKMEDIVTYDIWKIKKLKISEKKAMWIFLRFLFFVGFWYHIKPVKGAKEKLDELKKRGYKFYVVTGRHYILWLSTKLWLNKYYKGIFSGIKFANFCTRSSIKKSDICKKIGASVIIEDNLDNAIDCAKVGINVYLLDKLWNRDYDKRIHKGIIKVKGWDEINIG